MTPDRVAITVFPLPGEANGETRQAVTYAELDHRSEELAAGLVATGLARGDRVATLTGNSAEHVEVLFACAKAGLILVPLSPRLAPAEVAYQIDDAAPSLLLVAAEHAGLAEAALRLAREVPPTAELTPAGLDAVRLPSGDARAAVVEDSDPLMIVYTSGTTGKPKGAVLTHANFFWTNLSFDRIAEVTASDVILQVLPQFHCGGWNCQPLLAWWKGARVIIEPSFDAGRALRIIERERVTAMMGVPANYQFMAGHVRFGASDLSSLRTAVVGGAPMPETLLETWMQRGVALVQGYGLTEAAPNVACLTAADAARKVGWAGKPYPHVEVALADLETREILEGAAKGELLVRGPNVFAGYWRNDAATEEAFAGEWLRTGDVAERDREGFYRILDRLKDMFVSGGENVYPAEVEAALYEHAGVAEAAVVGVPDERWGEVGCAWVVLRPGAVAGAEDLLAHCRTRLARYKVPREVRFLDLLPRSGVNKVLKTELLSRWRSEPEPAVAEAGHSDPRPRGLASGRPG
ncbi:MAG TPA: long-chain fatty acid--CoA ligase [Actinomycetota bacterium]|nr:long-chain fatty acid--CoA ligase [Actinomycetota bacterium]